MTRVGPSPTLGALELPLGGTRVYLRGGFKEQAWR